jgi:hypothetical protein
MDNDDKGPAEARDGLIDFGRYTTDQLVELESSVDRERFLSITHVWSRNCSVENARKRQSTNGKRADGSICWRGWGDDY